MYRTVLMLLLIVLIASAGTGLAMASTVKVTARKYSMKSPKGTCTYDIFCPTLSGIQDKAVERTINDFLSRQFKPQHMEEDETTALDAKSTIHAESTFKVPLLNTTTVSIKMDIFSYLKGAAHPNDTFEAWTIDLRYGTVYRFKDLFMQLSPYEPRIKGYVMQAAARALHSDSPVSIGRDFTDLSYYLTPKSLVVFNLFDAHALESLEVSIPYGDIAGLADPKGPLASFVK